MKRRAFTLIELLVVVAIIAILISILLPALGRARASARQTQCATNQRNVAIALRLYADENRDYHHAVWDNNALRFRPLFANHNYVLRPYTIDQYGRPQATQAYWASIYDQLLGVYYDPRHYIPSQGIGSRTYLKGWENTRCPDAQYTLPAFRNNGILRHDPYTLYSSYCFNGVTPGFDSIPKGRSPTFFEKGPTGRRVPTRISTIKFPADLIMFQDGSEVVLDGNGDTLIQLDQWTDSVAGDEKKQWIREYFRHPGGCVAAWTDGHVSVISKNKAEKKKQQVLSEHRTVHGVPLPWYSARQ